MNQLIAKSFHAYADDEFIYFHPRKMRMVETREEKHIVTQERSVSYRFFLHEHPYVKQLSARLIQKSVAGLQAADTDYVQKPDGSFETLPDQSYKPVLFADFFQKAYQPDAALVPNTTASPYPVKDLDFTYSGAYAAYNWELFFHVPFTVALHLSKNGRYAEAQRWFHFIFDPTDDSAGPIPAPQRFWKVRPFQYTHAAKIEEILMNLSTDADPQLRTATVRSIEAWKDAPFRPHVIARYRQQAYMFKTVMAYLDNLIAWGDSLFRQDTGESINEAMIVYVLAANLLGPRPQAVPQKGTMRPQTYANLRADLDKFGNTLRNLEADGIFDLMPHPSEVADNERLAVVRGLGKALYFCTPRNDKLLAYWDTVADRLFKIRNSLNIQGIFRQLPLFEPPIDPALLARATAAGLDVGAVVNGLNQPLPLVRFQLLAQKAAEIVQEVKSLGNALLSAMEKEDGEAMAILRARHERSVLDMVELVKYGQLQEAAKAREGVIKTLQTTVERYTYLERQLRKQPDEIAKALPVLGDLETDLLQKMKLAAKEPEVALREVGIDIAQDLGDAAGKIMSNFEVEELKKSSLARDLQDIVKVLNLGAQGLSLIPDFKVDLHFWGLGGSTDISGGSKLSQVARFAANVALAAADRFGHEAGTAAKVGGADKREQDWEHQSNVAAREITQINKQLRAAQIREAVANLELENHRAQMANAQEIEDFLNEEGANKRGKTTNKALYTWMKREVKGLYSQAFQMAFDMAKKAERALQHELGDPSLTFIQYGYLAGKEGLLAGERLYLDLKRMELAYLDLNQREYELTKHVSLLQVDPLALLKLRATGRCTVRLPEALFDMDGPGHYFRRIKSVAVSIPCVTGPYAGVNCTLTLLQSSIRTKPTLADGGYARSEDGEDERFDDYFGSLQSVVTSSGQNDSGLFETNLRDERYLPFEYAGVIGEWQLALPADPSQGDLQQFDYDTISDVILHIRYTAREGGALLRTGATKQLKDLQAAGAGLGSVRLFSLRHEFPTAWAAYKAATAVNGVRPLKITLTDQHYPFWSRPPAGMTNQVLKTELIARATGEVKVAKPDGSNPDTAGPFFGALTRVEITQAPQPPFAGEWHIGLGGDTIQDAWLLVYWGLAD